MQVIRSTCLLMTEGLEDNSERTGVTEQAGQQEMTI